MYVYHYLEYDLDLYGVKCYSLRCIWGDWNDTLIEQVTENSQETWYIETKYLHGMSYFQASERHIMLQIFSMTQKFYFSFNQILYNTNVLKYVIYTASKYNIYFSYKNILHKLL